MKIKNNRKPQYYRGFKVSLAWSAGLFLMFAVPGYACAESIPEQEKMELAMHHGSPHGGMHERHQRHHGMGRGGEGICPQTRTTPKAPVTMENLKNPLKPTRDVIRRGESIFHWTAEPSACKVCHGPTGNGMGMMAQSTGAMPRNFTCKETMQELTDGQMFWIIKNGSQGTGMPPFPFLSEEEIWSVILYVRQLVK